MSTSDPLDQLKKLAELRDQGVVTPEEFEAAKAQLLASVGQPGPASQVESKGAEPPVPSAAESSPPAAPPEPEAAHAPLPPLEQLSDAELVGRVRAADVAQAEQQWRLLEQALRAAGTSRTRLRRRRLLARLRLRYNYFAQAARKMFDRGLRGRSGSAAILLAAIVGLVLIVTAFCTLNPTILLAAALVSGLLGYLWLRNLLFYPTDSDVVSAARRLRQEIADFAEPIGQSQEEWEKLASQCRDARKTYERLHAAMGRRKRRLLASDWRSLRGIGFTRFLAEVFEDLGFAVQASKLPGDQPVDLILTRGDLRIAVQAAAQEGGVGNGVVRQTHAAKIAGHCHRCCVITNSRFSAGARQLAAELGCQLIDGSQIADLIRGKIAV